MAAILRFGMKTGGDGKSNKEAGWDPGRMGTAVTSGRRGSEVSPSRSIPETNDEEGDMGIPASATGIPKGSQSASLNSSQTSEEFGKSENWSWVTLSLKTQSSSAKVEESLWLGVTRESVLPIDVAKLSGGVGQWVMTAAWVAGGEACGRKRRGPQLYIAHPCPIRSD